MILLHGLEGSSMAHYMGGISDKAWTAGWNVVRLTPDSVVLRSRVEATTRLSERLDPLGVFHPYLGME